MHCLNRVIHRHIVSGAIILSIALLASCAPKSTSPQKNYGSEDLAKQWRERTQQAYPADNDSEYYYPKYRRQPTPPIRGGYYPPQRQPYSPDYDPYRYAPLDNDTNYYTPQRYPTYDSSQDNPSSNDGQYNYPLFFDD